MESVSTDAGTARPLTLEVLKDAIVVDTERVWSHLDEVVRSTVEETLDQLLDEEADRVAGAAAGWTFLRRSTSRKYAH